MWVLTFPKKRLGNKEREGIYGEPQVKDRKSEKEKRKKNPFAEKSVKVNTQSTLGGSRKVPWEKNQKEGGETSVGKRKEDSDEDPVSQLENE